MEEKVLCKHNFDCVTLSLKRLKHKKYNKLISASFLALHQNYQRTDILQ